MMKRVLVLALCVFAALSVSACKREPIGGPIPQPKSLSQETTPTYVYFATGRSLLEEERVVNANDVYRATLDELLAGNPKSNEKIAIVQPQAKVLSLTVKDKVLTIDWSAEVLAFEAEPKEIMIAQAAILRTFGQFPAIEKVRYTVEGKTSGKVGGKDVEAFWQTVSLKGQPWNVIRPTKDPDAESTSTPAASETAQP